MAPLPSTVVVCTDRDDWAVRAVEACLRVDAIPERTVWARVTALADPPAALLLDAQPPLTTKYRMFDAWARDAWQPVCVVSVSPALGVTEFTDKLDALCYRYVLQAAYLDEHWQTLASDLRGRVDACARLVPHIARATSCFELPIVVALWKALGLIPELRSVQRWARQLGMSRREELEGTFAAYRFPPPKTMLEWLRLLRVIDAGQHSERRISRNALARAFRYSSGDYLGRRAKALTGFSLGELLAHGPEWAIRVMCSNLPSSGDRLS